MYVVVIKDASDRPEIVGPFETFEAPINELLVIGARLVELLERLTIAIENDDVERA